MKFLLLKSKRLLAIASGIIFAGLLVVTFSEKMTMELAEAHQTENITDSVLSVTEVNIHENMNVAEVEVEEDLGYIPDADQVERIRVYLANRKSPLADYALEFVKAADHYGIDYRLVASISVIESGGGKHCFKPYNAWGWGKKGFDNWTDGIWTVSKGLAKYYQNGLTTPKLISTYYCPSNATNWGNKVQFVMNEIAK
ncbi:MAG: hypothetical protein ACOX6Q_03375 [Candidatus Dojkabacteria bacterium]|jgi:hypothetical protein